MMLLSFGGGPNVIFRRDFIKLAGSGLVGATGGALAQTGGEPQLRTLQTAPTFNVRSFGASGDGKTIDSPAINQAIHAASQAGGGTVLFPAGTYASYSIHLQSSVALYLACGSHTACSFGPARGHIERL